MSDLQRVSGKYYYSFALADFDGDETLDAAMLFRPQGGAFERRP